LDQQLGLSPRVGNATEFQELIQTQGLRFGSRVGGHGSITPRFWWDLPKNITASSADRTNPKLPWSPSPQLAHFFFTAFEAFFACCIFLRRWANFVAGFLAG
jgi:hypothetical protein